MKHNTTKTDFLIIGSGAAGLYAALHACERGSVTIVTKGAVEDCNTAKAQGGIAGALGESDSPYLHREDTLSAGDGLCFPDAVEILTQESPNEIRNLQFLGTAFDAWEGRISLTREGAHCRNRIAHANGDATGKEIERALIHRAINNPAIAVLDRYFAVDLLISDGCCHGAYVFNRKDGTISVVYARAVIMATGGIGQLFIRTTNPPIATGSGIAMAYRAGASLTDLEFVQFHPTALYIPPDNRDSHVFLISEAMRGEGAVLRNERGERFMETAHPQMDLAPRDVISRVILEQLENQQEPYVNLDISAVNNFPNRFPTIFLKCKEVGIPMEKKLIPVAPAAHFHMGGIMTDLWGETDIPGLFAAGECACTGVHGANRLASNSLCEAVVFGKRAAKAAAQKYMTGKRIETAAPETDIPIFDGMRAMRSFSSSGDGQPASDEETLLRKRAWQRLGIVRCGISLTRIRDDIWERIVPAFMKRVPRGIFDAGRITPARFNSHLAGTYDAWEPLFEEYNEIVLADMIGSCARMRAESRGAHFREDFPKKEESLWRKHLKVKKGENVQYFNW